MTVSHYSDLPLVTLTVENNELTIVGRRSGKAPATDVVYRESHDLDYRRVFDLVLQKRNDRSCPLPMYSISYQPPQDIIAMKTLAFAFAGFYFIVSVFVAQAVESYKISGIDVTSHAVTISDRSTFKTYQVRPTANITVNGIKASFLDLKKGMKVSLVFADSESLATIAATGSQKFSTTTSSITSSSQQDELSRKLAGTKWTWPDSKIHKQDGWFILNPDGTANAGWHKKVGGWKVLTESTVEIQVTNNPGTETLRFNKDLTEATEDGKEDVVYHRVK